MWPERGDMLGDMCAGAPCGVKLGSVVEPYDAACGKVTHPSDVTMNQQVACWDTDFEYCDGTGERTTVTNPTLQAGSSFVDLLDCDM